MPSAFCMVSTSRSAYSAFITRNNMLREETRKCRHDSGIQEVAAEVMPAAVDGKTCCADAMRLG